MNQFIKRLYEHETPPAIKAWHEQGLRELIELHRAHNAVIDAEIEMFLISGAMLRDLHLIQQMPRWTMPICDATEYMPQFPSVRIA